MERDDAMSNDDDESICGNCNGSGEGMYDGSTCGHCGGSGVASGEADEQDPPDDWRRYEEDYS